MTRRERAELRAELEESRKERNALHNQFVKLMTTIREDYALQITRVNAMVNNLVEIQNNMVYMDENGEMNDEKNGEVRNLSR